MQTSLVRVVLWVGRSNAFAAVASLIVGIMTARWLGPAGRGNYALFVTTATIVSIFSSMGIYHATIYYISKGKISRDAALGSVLIITGANLVILPVICVVWIALFGSGIYLFHSVWIATALVLASVYPILRDGFGGIAMAEKQYSIYTNQLIIEPVLILFTTAFLLWTVRADSAAVLLRVLGSTFALGFMFWQIWRRIPMRPSFSVSVLGQEVVFGIQAVFQSALMMLNFRVYLYFLAAVSTEAAGWYSIALIFCELVRFVPQAVGGAIFPFLSTATSEQANRMAAISCRLMLAAGGAVALGFTLVHNQLVHVVFGPAFQPAAFASVLMVWGAVLGIAYQMLGTYFTSVNRQDIMILASGGGLLVGLLAAAVLVPRLGIDGAGYAYLASSVAIACVCNVAFARVTGMTPAVFLLPQREDLHRLIAMSAKYVSWSR